MKAMSCKIRTSVALVALSILLGGALSTASADDLVGRDGLGRVDVPLVGPVGKQALVPLHERHGDKIGVLSIEVDLDLPRQQRQIFFMQAEKTERSWDGEVGLEMPPGRVRVSRTRART